MKSSEAMIFAVITGPLEPTNHHVSGFIAQLVRASQRNREVTGSNPVEVLNFSGFSTQIAKIAFITAKIIASLDFTSAVHI